MLGIGGGIRAECVRPPDPPRRTRSSTSSRFRSSRSCRLRRRSDAATILERPPDESTEAVGTTPRELRLREPAACGAKTVMVTSAGPREGKSTTIANLAIALARTGRHVVLVDLDLRRPMLSRLLPSPRRPGITDFASRDTELVDVAAARRRHAAARASRIDSVAREVGQGRLEVITTGRTRVEPAAFVESERLDGSAPHAPQPRRDRPGRCSADPRDRRLDRADRQGRCASSWSRRLGTLTRPTLQELARVLRSEPAPVLGLVATGAEIDEGYSVYSVDEYSDAARPQAEAPTADTAQRCLRRCAARRAGRHAGRLAAAADSRPRPG